MMMNNCYIKADQATKNDNDESCTMSSFSSGFEETDALFLEFDDEFNNGGGSSSMGDNSSESLYLKDNWAYIAPIEEKPISPYTVRFSQAICVCVRHTFLFCYLKWTDVGREYIENQMLKLQSQPTQEGSQPLSGDEICDKVLGRRPDYSKVLSWGPKYKFHKSCASSSLTSFSQAKEFEDANVMIKYQRVELEEAKCMIEEQRRTSALLTSQMEEMSQAQRGP
ncbi:cytochrome P450 CYP82D47-like [Cucumis melo var. makuwa]|uniref:Cytochrome P450 CYP82D47-like n=1 Tax=Cucumis melo var. makuwa TaxID=1194695 RepID=A0A5D3BND6_CUCMM|nr:cytochrome P450 CYP82D47-like [Cucumis melo var. makuwa]TYK01311.1 cytochrome P450 CYP82D47-like [Cucumis melo var. makuwa]